METCKEYVWMQSCYVCVTLLSVRPSFHVIAQMAACVRKLCLQEGDVKMFRVTAVEWMKIPVKFSNSYRKSLSLSKSVWKKKSFIFQPSGIWHRAAWYLEHIWGLGYELGDVAFDSPSAQYIFHAPNTSAPALGSTPSHIQRVAALFHRE